MNKFIKELKKRRYLLYILSAITVGISLIIKLPKVIDDSVNKAVEQNKEFVHGYNVCDITLQAKKYKEGAECFKELLKKYDRSDVRYNYAFALASLKEYEQAKKELDYIIDNEKEMVELIEASKNLNKQIDNELAKLRIKTTSYKDIESNNVDVGDYFSDLKEYTLWKKPTNITVYIEDDPKKELFERAFTQWNGALDGTVYFKFIDTKDNADIRCSFVQKTKGDEGGFTDWYYYEEEKKKYFQNSNITVAKYSPLDGKIMSDDQVYSIILHEIGHALGISDHSPFKGDIMYFSTDSFLNEKGMISKRDINTIKKLYKKL